jgi:hypothetical protein
MRIDGKTIGFTGDAVIAEKGCDQQRIRAGESGSSCARRVHIVSGSIGGTRGSYEASQGGEITWPDPPTGIRRPRLGDRERSRRQCLSDEPRIPWTLDDLLCRRQVDEAWCFCLTRANAGVDRVSTSAK